MHKLTLFIILIIYSLFAETFDLNFAFTQYNDTTVEFDYYSFDPNVTLYGKYKTYDWDGIHFWDYEVKEIGNISGFGRLEIMKSESPAHPMYYSHTYSLVTHNTESLYNTLYGKDPDKLSSIEYEKMLKSGDPAMNPMGDFFYNAEYTQCSSDTLDSNYLAQRYEIVPIVRDEINTGEGDDIYNYPEYTVFLTNTKGQNVRIQILFERYNGAMDGIGEYIKDTRLRISTDSSGNGKFKQKTDIFIQKPNEITKTIATVQGRKVLFPVNFLGEEVTISNCQGREIKTLPLSSPSLLLEKIPAGIYFITIKGRNGLRQKVILK